jgi:catechol 2,3-dioxygenase-like lactoylglutathione lyase family enzyme
MHAVTKCLGRLVIATAVAVCAAVASQDRAGQPTRTFAAQIAALSEPGGYFDTDNLVSNERSYLDVVPDLQRANVKDGAYVGVGPDQNFSYITAVRPSIAVIVDIRRDNLLLHLLFKALFEMSRTRVEYMALLFDREVPQPPADWRQKSIQELVAYIDAARAPASAALDARRARIRDRIKGFGVALSAADLQTIDRFHRRFGDAGLGLLFQSTGRAPQFYNPTYRQLLLATDPAGRHGSFLAAEDGFQFLKSLQARDLLIPIVGDFAGPKALAAVGRFLTGRKERVSVFYASNVEFYLFRYGTFPRFVANLGHLPRAPNAIMIRSVFSGGGSTSVTQPLGELIEGFSQGRFRLYGELVRR